MSGEREVRRLAERYAVAVDTADPAALADLFTADGALIIRAMGRREPLSEFRGSGTEGVGLMARLLGEVYESTLHHVTTHLADVRGDEATAITYCVAQHVASGDDGRIMESVGVRYDDTCVRRDGSWRFRSRDVTCLWVRVEPLPRVGLLLDPVVTAALRGA